eukprot:Filipodium_phascolosomae@DN2393_c0_g1_i1.p1
MVERKRVQKSFGVTDSPNNRDEKSPIITRRQQEDQRCKERRRVQHFIGCLLALLLCGGCFQFVSQIYSIFFNSVTLVDPTDTSTLQRIMFHGDPHLVLCVNSDEPTSTQTRLHPVIDGASQLLRRTGVKTVVVDCNKPMATGKTIAQRFSLNKRSIGFVVANGDKPIPFTSTEIATVNGFKRVVETAASKKIHKVAASIDLKKFCFTKKTCLIIGYRSVSGDGYLPSRLEKLLVEASTSSKLRTVALVAVDTHKYGVRLPQQLIDSRMSEERSKLTMLCIKHDDKNSTLSSTAPKREIPLIGKFMDMEEDLILNSKNERKKKDLMSDYLLECSTPDQEKFVSLSFHPTVKTKKIKKSATATSSQPETKRDKNDPSENRKEYVGARESEDNDVEPVENKNFSDTSSAVEGENLDLDAELAEMEESISNIESIMEM